MATDNLLQVLEGYDLEHIPLEERFLNQALVAATDLDNHECIGKLIKMGATDITKIDECIQLAKEKGKINAATMLILSKIGLTGDKMMLHIIFGDATSSLEFAALGVMNEETNLKMKQAVESGEVSTVYPLEVAQQNGHHSVVRRLLLLTRINKSDGSVKWSDLHLVSTLDNYLIKGMYNWVRVLDLSSNKLKCIPAEIEILTEVCNIDLNGNELTQIPATLLQLPNLKTLNLSHNKLTCLPDVLLWSKALVELNLSDNCLSSLPINATASSLTYLNLSKNQFNTVPLCVCTFLTLTSLDLSDNPRIRTLPHEMSMLTKLEHLNIKGLKRLKEPPNAFMNSPPQCISYLRSKLNNRTNHSHCKQLMIVGSPESGKHTFVSKLLGSYEYNSRIYTGKWKCRPNGITKRAVRFRMWVFNSLEDYAFTHDCFLSQHSLYLLLFDAKHESEGVYDAINTWLERIACRAPYSSIILIGTHMDEISHQDHKNGEILLQQVKTASKVYANKLEIAGILQISLKHQQMVTKVVDKIHSYAANYPHETIQSNQIQVLNEFLMKENVYPDEGHVHWRGLQLCRVGTSLLREIYWVKKLNLSRNKLTTLPEELGDYLKQVVKIDLQHNDIASIPGCLLELPNLSELDLAHNRLLEIPDVPKWSPCLTVLDLSDNQLSSLPSNVKVIASNLRSLNISKNKFCTVPPCICSFTTLCSLDLSDNSKILALPAQMGRLKYLSYLNLKGLKKLNDPPKSLHKSCHDCLHYLNNKLYSARGFYRMKLMLLGNTECGKTTLVARLQDKECHKSTFGLDISEWCYSLSIGSRCFQFSIWDFSGKEEYYASHQCFLSQHSLYLLLFNIKHGIKGVEELKPWLNNIALQAPHSCVLIVGTHLDEIPAEEREEVEVLMHHVDTIAASYKNELQTVDIIPVGLKNSIENVGILKEAIYCHAANYKNARGQLVMEQTVPTSYYALEKRLETVQQEVRKGIREPIMHIEEFKTMVQQMGLSDLQDDEELSAATLFLTDVGSLLHFDDRGHNLHELYFLDPCWLYDVISKVVNNEWTKNGILNLNDIPTPFQDKQFPCHYSEQYCALLDKFEIALPLDKQRSLIPSMLPDERPEEFEDEKPDCQQPTYSRLILFSSSTPPGFWNRLLSKIMHSISRVCRALDKSILATESAHCPITLNHHNTDHTELGRDSMTHVQSNEVEDSSAAMSLNVSTVSSLGAQAPSAAASLIPKGSLPPSSVSAESFINIQWSVVNIQKPNNQLFDSNDIHLKYWKTGLYYKDPETTFRIESLQGSKQFKQETKDGIFVIASANRSGTESIAQLIDLIMSLISEWYPGLKLGQHGLQQKVPCYECIRQGQPNPFMFKVEQCLLAIARNETKLECDYFHDDPIRNHSVCLTDIVPDLLLQDIDADFLLDAKDIASLQDDNALLSKGTYGEVYHGRHKRKATTIKKYLYCSEEAFTEFRSEAKLLQRMHHPCLVCLIGICVQPLMALVLEEVPLKSLDFQILKKKIPVHRLTIFRMAVEVAAALRFLHSQGIIYRDLKAANVFLWTLNPDSLCHCKLANFDIATQLAPIIGTKGLQGTKGFIAPEVMHISKRNQHSVYDHRADIFSFGMFVYQMIARRHPYRGTTSDKTDVAIESGERPQLQDICGYHYLSQIMKICWEDNPNNRFDSCTIIKKLCQLPTQMVMCVVPFRRNISLHRAIAITPPNFVNAGCPNQLQTELWVYCDSKEGAEICVFNIHTMTEIKWIFIKNNQIECMAFCDDQLWMGSQSRNESGGVVKICSVGSRELLKHNIHVYENQSITCITATDKSIYMGTREGYCFSYRDTSEIPSNINLKPKHKRISEHAIDGIVCTQQHVWIAHTKYINLLMLDNLAPSKFCLKRLRERGKEMYIEEAYIGQLSIDCDRNIIWSAHLGGVILSAWDAHNKCHKYDIDTGSHLKRITNAINDVDIVITAMTPALDSVWVGMATGHIMIFHRQELVSWFHPYKGCIHFLTCIPSAGPCGVEKAMVASGGTKFTPLVECLDKDFNKSPESGTVVVWEAYEARTMKQMKLIEENAPDHLDNRANVCQIIQEGEFRDGTHLLLDPIISTGTESPPFENPVEYSLECNIHTPSQTKSSLGSSSAENEHLHSIVPKPNAEVVSLQSQAPIIDEEKFRIKIPDSEQTILVRCPIPPKLKVLHSEVQVTLAQDHCMLVYCKNEKVYGLQTQQNFEDYLRLPDKPQLCIVITETNTPRIDQATNTEFETVGDPNSCPQASIEQQGFCTQVH